MGWIVTRRWNDYIGWFYPPWKEQSSLLTPAVKSVKSMVEIQYFKYETALNQNAIILQNIIQFIVQLCQATNCVQHAPSGNKQPSWSPCNERYRQHRGIRSALPNRSWPSDTVFKEVICTFRLVTLVFLCRFHAIMPFSVQQVTRGIEQPSQ